MENSNLRKEEVYFMGFGNKSPEKHSLRELMADNFLVCCRIMKTKFAGKNRVDK